jgi:hypothetical protein
MDSVYASIKKFLIKKSNMNPDVTERLYKHLVKHPISSSGIKRFLIFVGPKTTKFL